jgi:putative heme-binding domain-containing protein
MALDPSDATPAHMHALWLLVSQHQLERGFLLKVMGSPDAATRNWGVRGVGEMQTADDEVYRKLESLTKDPSADVRVQVAVAAGRLQKPEGLGILTASLRNTENAKDPLIPTIIYDNILPLIPKRGAEILASVEKDPAITRNFGDTVVRWIRDAANALNRTPAQIAASLQSVLPPSADDLRRAQVERKVRSELQGVVDAFNTLGVKPDEAGKLFERAAREKIVAIASGGTPSRVPATLIALWWRDPKALESARSIISDPRAEAPVRGEFVRALGGQRDAANTRAFAALVADDNAPILIRQNAVNALGAMNDPEAAAVLIDRFDGLPTDLRPMVVNAMVLSKASAAALLDAVQKKTIGQNNMNENHARTISGMNDRELSKKLTEVWGKVGTERDPARAGLVAEYKALFQSRGGDASKGWRVFEGKCAQCHTIYGHGGNVGPDLTGVGRDNLELVLSNVLDPSLVIGKPYYVYVARQTDGTVFNGILVEDSPKQIVLKEPTGTHVIPRDRLSKLVQQNISMMPEGLEQTMSKEEFCDLVAFLLTKGPPEK